MTVPAKVQAYMSVFTPILGVLSGEEADIILNEAKCGITVDAGDYKDLAKFALEISSNQRENWRKWEKTEKFFLITITEFILV